MPIYDENSKILAYSSNKFGGPFNSNGKQSIMPSLNSPNNLSKDKHRSSHADHLETNGFDVNMPLSLLLNNTQGSGTFKNYSKQKQARPN